MKTFLFYTASFLLIVICSCNKKETSPTVSSGTNNIPTTNLIYGSFQTNYLTLDYGNGLIINDSSSQAQFLSVPTTNTVNTNCVYGGIVKLNGVQLDFDTINKKYSSPFLTTITTPLTWQASGSGTITAFTHSYIPNYPYCNTSLGNLDTCYKANGFVVTTNNVINENYYGAEITVFQGVNTIRKTIFGSGGTAVISPLELMSFNANSPLYINVFVLNYNEFNVGAVRYSFSNTYVYYKFSYLK